MFLSEGCNIHFKLVCSRIAYKKKKKPGLCLLLRNERPLWECDSSLLVGSLSLSFISEFSAKLSNLTDRLLFDSEGKP